MKTSIVLFHLIPITYYSNISPVWNYPTGDISIPIIILILIAFIFISAKKKKTTFLDMAQTDQMKGLAILFIIFFHYTTKIFANNNPYYNTINLLGPMGVGTFLLLSGYGLTVSYMKNGLKGFLRKRFLRVFIPYWIVICGFLLLSLILHQNLNPLYFFQLFFILNPPSIPPSSTLDPLMWWFVSYICLEYIFFFAIFRTKFSHITKLALLFIPSIMITALYNIQIHPSGQIIPPIWAFYSLSFPIGAIIGVYSNNLAKLFNTYTSAQRSFLSIILLFLSIGSYPFLNGTTSFAGPSFIFMSIGIFAIVWFIASFNILSRFLNFLGHISYELFLIHLPLILTYDFALFHKPYVISFFFFFFITILLASLLHYREKLAIFIHLLFFSTEL